MITITFDDAINNNNIDLYKEIFKGRRNPNGCDIKATYFISHKYTNYSAVQETARKGHEIAVHSITWVKTLSFKPRIILQFKTDSFLSIFKHLSRHI